MYAVWWNHNHSFHFFVQKISIHIASVLFCWADICLCTCKLCKFDQCSWILQKCIDCIGKSILICWLCSAFSFTGLAGLLLMWLVDLGGGKINTVLMIPTSTTTTTFKWSSDVSSIWMQNSPENGTINCAYCISLCDRFAAVWLLLKSRRKYAWMKMSPAAAAILAKPLHTDEVLKAARSWKFCS